MLQLRIKELLESKGIHKPFSWLRSLGISHHVAYKMLNRNNNHISQKNLSLICQHAWCTPNDIFEYDDKQNLLEENHPLLNLRAQASNNLFEQLQKMSPERLKALNEWIEQNGKGDSLREES